MSRNAAQPGVAADELLAVARTSQLNASIVRRLDVTTLPLSRRQVLVTVSVPVVVAIAGWLIGGESSPVHEYFFYHVTLPNRMAALNLPAFILAALLSGKVHAPAYWALLLAFLAQWLPVGYLLSRLFIRKPVSVRA
jgi:hypothetical protein